MYVCQLSRLKFSAPVIPMYFYCIYTNIYSISYMTSLWFTTSITSQFYAQLPMHSMDVCTLIILVKFQNFHTRTSPCTVVIGTVYPNIPLSSASIHGHPRSSLGATLGVRMSVTAYGNHSTVSSVWPIGASRLNLRPHAPSI